MQRGAKRHSATPVHASTSEQALLRGGTEDICTDLMETRREPNQEVPAYSGSSGRYSGAGEGNPGIVAGDSDNILFGG